MKMSNFEGVALPIIPVDSKLGSAKEIAVNDLSGVGAMRGSYGAGVGETIEFPDTEADVKLRQIPLNNGKTQNVVLVAKNGKLAWFGLSNLRRRDNKMKPVHPLCEAIEAAIKAQSLADDDLSRLKLCFGKKVTSSESVEYDETVFTPEGTRTDDTRKRNTAKLHFVE